MSDVTDIDLIHELALIEDLVRTDLSFLAGDVRDLSVRSDYTHGYDTAALSYAKVLGLVTTDHLNDNGWII